ncbi:MAG: hypothetical protein IPI67_07730 [Myxococcales bacterium]|nr:hypothetical protein [Myxococcales bacterium]
MSSTTTRFLGAAALVLLGSSACGSTSSDSDATGGAASSGGAGGGGGTGGASEPALCDGSASIRFSATLGGGMVMPSYVFHQPLWLELLLRDRRLRVLPGRERAGRGEERKVGPPRARKSSQPRSIGATSPVTRAGWTWAAQTPATWPSATVRARRIAAAVVIQMHPKDWSPPSTPHPVEEKLWNEGSPLDGPVAAAAQTKEVTAQPAKAWPLSWPITDLPLPNEPGGKVVTDAGDAAKLRGLREGSTFEGVLIDVGGLRYELFVRDEFPDAVKTAIAASK